ncbi:MAG TPA: tRNA dihydrouridine synthase DusB [Thermodesulfovibrionales bacterium]|nr:tRNA dihydrouridine synthase DusB [Thermodesulfovibrionales bacterium]
MLSIGDLKVPSSLVLAPMAGISDLPFRLINRSFGCELAFTEMISASSLTHGSKNTLKMLDATSDDRPLGVQILAADTERIKRALDILSEYAFDLIDLNAACPVKKVVSRGEGAALLREPAKLQSLLGCMVKESGIPVTLKIRSGWDETQVNATEIALRAQDAGVNGLFIHGRTKMQGYGGEVDYHILGGVKDSVAIPVIAGGNALTPHFIERLFQETGCDGVAVARGALGNPWIFPKTMEYLESRTVSSSPDVSDITRIMKEHLASNAAFYGEKTGVVHFRKFFTWYTRGIPVQGLKVSAFLAKTLYEMMRLIDEVQASQADKDCFLTGGNELVPSYQPPERFGCSPYSPGLP